MDPVKFLLVKQIYAREQVLYNILEKSREPKQLDDLLYGQINRKIANVDYKLKTPCVIFCGISEHTNANNALQTMLMVKPDF